MVRSLDLFQGSARVILLVCAGEVATVKFWIVFLLAVIRQRLAGNLPSGNTAAVSETCDKQGVDAGVPLKPIQNRLNTFVNKGYGSNLDTDCSARGLRLLWKMRGNAGSTD